jgi:hypothetical protein
MILTDGKRRLGTGAGSVNRTGRVLCHRLVEQAGAMPAARALLASLPKPRVFALRVTITIAAVARAALGDKTCTGDDRKRMEARLELYRMKKPYRDE